MKKLFLFFTSLAVINYGNAQEYLYSNAKSIGTPVFDYLMASSIDGNSNVIYAVQGSSIRDYDPGSAIFTIPTSSSSGVTICKLSDLGNFIWAKAIYPSSIFNSMNVSSICTDPSGNIFFTGQFNGTVDFDPSAGVFNLTTLGGQNETYICKINANGVFAWVKKFNNVNSSSSTNYANAIALNSNNDIFIGGLHSGVTDFDPGANSYNSNLGSSYLCKLSSSGNFIWVKEFASSNGSTQINDIAIVGLNDIYLTGETMLANYANTIDANPGSGISNLNLIASTSIYHIYQSYFTIKLNDGNFSWAFVGGGSSIAADAQNNCYVAGIFSNTVDFNPQSSILNLTSNGFNDSYIAKFNSTGQFQYVKQIGGSGDDRVFDLKTDNLNNVYACGRFELTINLGTNIYCSSISLTSELTANSGSTLTYSYDAFIVKYNQSGGLIFADKLGGNSSDRASFIGVSFNGLSITLVGNFSNIVDFNSGTGVANLSSIGDEDIFTTRMVKCVSSNCTTPSGCRVLSANNVDVSNSRINLFPNPSNGNFTLDLGKEYKQANVRITNITGKVLEEYQYKDLQNTAMQFDGAPGFYWLDITTEEGKLPRMKLMKE